MPSVAIAPGWPHFAMGLCRLVAVILKPEPAASSISQHSAHRSDHIAHEPALPR